MSRLLRAGFAALAAALTAGIASAASPQPRIVEAGGAGYPDRAYILTLPAPKALSHSDVKVTENGKPVQGLSVVRQGTAENQTAVVLAIDSSASMQGGPITDAVKAARVFAARMTPGEQVAVVMFNKDVDVRQGFTTDKAKVAAALEQAPELAVGTKINDALDKSLKMIASSGSPNASIVLLSDGTDVGSAASRAEVVAALKGGHVRVFSVGLASRSFNKKSLQGFANASRGQFVVASGPSQLAPIYSVLGRRLGSEYLLGYRSRVNPSQKVLVKVSVKGFPSAAQSEYTTPALHVVAAKPYNPSRVDRAIQSPYVALVVALVFALLIGSAVMHVATSRSDPLVERVGDFVSVQRGVVEPETPKSEKGRPGFITRMTQRREASWSTRMADTLELAGITAEPMHVVILTALVTILLAFLLGVVVGPVGVVVGLFTPLVVLTVIKRRVAKTRRAFGEQLPDNLDVLASALRAGHSLVSALAVVADDANEPSKSEFRRVLGEEQFGVQLEDAFKTTVDRMENVDLEQVALVARLQREMGSNSAEVLDKVIETVRGRMELRRLIRTLTAQGRLSRWILTLLPLALALMLTLISPGYMRPLFHTLPGQLLLILAGLMVALGSWIIGKIVDIRV